MPNCPPITFDEAKEIHTKERVTVSDSHLFELVQLANDIAERHGEDPRSLMEEWAQAEYERVTYGSEAIA